MKKVLNFVFIAIITLVLSSCKKDALNVDPSTLDNFTHKCWHVTITYNNTANSVSESLHKWDNERSLVIYLQKNYGASDCRVSYMEDTKYGPATCETADDMNK